MDIIGNSIVESLVSHKPFWKQFEENILTGKMEGSPIIKVNNVSEMQKTSLETGSIITTNGFYDSDDGGGATYVVRDIGPQNNITIFQLYNGLFAHLIVSTKMSILQFGAINTTNVQSAYSIFDNAPCINKAVISGITELTFPKDGYFRIESPIIISKNNLTISGNGSSLFTDNDYPTPTNKYLEHVTIINSDNIVWNNLNIIELQTLVIIDVITQILINRSSNVTIKDSILRGPGPWLVKNEDNRHLFSDPNYIPMTYKDGERFNHNNVDLYSGWENIVVSGCDMYLSQDGPAGLSIMIRDISGLGCNNAVIENNYVEKVCHDEILAIGMPNATLSDITIRNNTFKMYDGKVSSSISGVLIGQSTTLNPTDNVEIVNNTFDIQTTRYSVRVDNLANEHSLSMANNTFNLSKGAGFGEDPILLIAFGSSTGQYLILNEPNVINVDNSDSSMVVNSVFFGDFEISNQTINIIGNLSGGVIEEARSLNNSKITCSGQLATIARDTDIATLNTVEANHIKFGFERYDKPINAPLNYSGNILKSSVATTVYLLYVQPTALVSETGYIDASNNRCIVDNAAKKNALIAIRSTIPSNPFILLSVKECTAELFDGTPLDFNYAFSLMAGITEAYISR